MNSSPHELKLTIPTGCDNAPRKQIVIDFTVAILTRENEVINEYADESIIWYQLKDNAKLEGRNALISTLYKEDREIISALEIYQVITHGKFASINGVMLLANGLKIDFCDVYIFSSAAKSGKIKEIKSYRI
ncbi:MULTISPECIES: hypothetical protein [Bacillus]|uniref:hypothetical protein n=1 Tax=Bacillus TaxID=1386 RepID=UPI0004678054|nr:MULTISPECIES: hypothetical protein [Bacillus]MDR4198021.1 hypothetical protein [Bacillus altitudinis]MEC0970223.1 hypothetical protein [Bacillus altitudinis]MEC1003460.1 hypothetical protein [Bacillus altitudinis]MEC3812808.1 hypothetical protein [Bacillus altitudinis]MEE3605110.1 hypothetical protein [Bacillus altitudinis]